MDLIDQALSDLRQESCVFCHVTVTEPWRIEKSASPVAPFYIVLSGCVQVVVEGAEHTLTGGDFLVLPRGSAHYVQGCTSKDAEPVPLLTLFKDKGIEPWSPGMRLRAVRFAFGSGVGEAAEFMIGLFYFGDPRQHPLLNALPPSLQLSTWTTSSSLQGGATFTAIKDEMQSGQPGWNLAIARHADLLFISALRDYFARDDEPPQGWLQGMRDPVVSRALIAMHQAPGTNWSLQTLAKQAGSSRASFAQRFSQVMGLSAMAYLVTWRMTVAARLLREGRCSVAEVADQVGYSADGFSTAFKHWSGDTPIRFRSRDGKELKSKG